MRTDADVYDWILHVLEDGIRQGGIEDVPEGTRYILISDTLALELAADLRTARSADKGRLSAASEVADGLVARIDELKAQIAAMNEREAERARAIADAALAGRHRGRSLFGRR